jgi:hypothetical protein
MDLFKTGRAWNGRRRMLVEWAPVASETELVMDIKLLVADDCSTLFSIGQNILDAYRLTNDPALSHEQRELVLLLVSQLAQIKAFDLSAQRRNDIFDLLSGGEKALLLRIGLSAAVGHCDFLQRRPGHLRKCWLKTA